VGTAREATAAATLYLRWTETSSTQPRALDGIGTDRIFAWPEDRITATLYLDIGSEGLSLYATSLEFDWDLVDELDLVDAEMLPVPTFTHLNGGAFTEANDSTTSVPGLVERYGATDPAQSDGPFNTTLAIGTVTFDVTENVSTDLEDILPFFEEGVDDVLDDEGLSVATTFEGAQVNQPPTALWHISRSLDTDSLIPGGSGLFSALSRSPVLAAFAAAMRGEGSGGQRGMYARFSGKLDVLADTGTTVPGGVASFDDFFEFDLGDAALAFRATISGGGEGIYERTLAGAPITALVEANVDAIPEGVGTFNTLGGLARDGADTAFVGTGSGGQQGVYTRIGGVLKMVADTSTTVPGDTSPFDFIKGTSPCFNQGRLVFGGGTGSEGSPTRLGIYRHHGGELKRVVDSSMTLPGSSSTFTDFGGASSRGGRLAFQASGSGGEEGIYRSDPLETVADTSTVIAGGGTFTGFGNVAQGDDGRVAFVGLGSKAIYSDESGSLEPLLAVGEPLDGRVIADLDLGSHAWDGERLAVWASFEDGSEAILVSGTPGHPIPTLGPLGLGLVAATLLLAGLAARPEAFSAAGGRARRRREDP
jgi:hypothetical protein